ncbi:MAG: YgiT-type zinc finger protein [Lachnospiraceae bacterium]|jgi:YgiT-type zinc finger domain-containing protein|nr:YgiT-type zinc finger protein [Lachnospiraceae bacterium]MBR1848392.1 YgiT-type zinc finger protein [Lachnospiraceae bacterium]
MTCIRCGHEVHESKTTEAIELKNGLLVIRNIPCYKCDACDEIQFTGEVQKKIEMIIQKAEEQMQEVAIVEYHNVA